MKHINEIESMEHTCVTYGNFDALHKGHQRLICQLVKSSREHNRKSVVVSMGAGEQEVLLTEQEKETILQSWGVDVMISLQKECVQKPEQLLTMLHRLGAELVLTGAGDSQKKLLEAEGLLVQEMDREEYDGSPITSEQVRTCLERGEVEKIPVLCGRPYRLCGTVVHGKGLGRTVGMPTVNLEVPQEKKKPMPGVYGTCTCIGGKPYLGVTNIGTRPTVDNLPTITIETMLLGFDEDIYGQRLETDVECFVRGIRKFENLEQVQLQVKKDAAWIQQNRKGLSLKS